MRLQGARTREADPHNSWSWPLLTVATMVVVVLVEVANATPFIAATFLIDRVSRGLVVAEDIVHTLTCEV